MPFRKPTFDMDRYFAGLDTQPIESFPVTKALDPLSGDWSYDNAIDLFSVNSMVTDTFSMDLPDLAIPEQDYFSLPLAPPPETTDFAMSSNVAEDAISLQSPSDLDSDGPLWSSTCPTSSPVPATAFVGTREPTPEEPTPRPTEQAQIKQEPGWTQSACWEDQPKRTPASDRRAIRGPKEQSSALPAPSGKAAKRAAHNVIEKRYRTNMNAKFVALEKATCDGPNKSTKAESGSLKKSEILANAISYVHDLQEKNRALQKELLFYKGGWRQPGRTKS